MDAATVVAKMCREEFSAADCQAVCRSRGFSVKAAASPKVLENLLLSEVGLAVSFAALTQEEVVLLHLLKVHSRPVSLPFFSRVYGASEHAWRETFTERYRETFKKVRVSLIRRGVLFFAHEAENPYDKKSKLERLVFVFPKEFQSLLPPLFPEVLRAPGPGEVNDSALRGKLRELLGAFRSGQPPVSAQGSVLSIADGELKFGDKELRAEHLLQWQKAAWTESLPKSGDKQKASPWSKDVGDHWSMDIVEAVMHATSGLEPGECFEPASLAPVLKVFCHGREIRESNEFRDEVCTLGWRWGCLARAATGGRICYRSAEAAAAEAVVKPTSWLLPDPKGGAVIDLARIPLRGVEDVARLSRFTAGEGGLHARPDPVKIGRVIKSVGREPVALWLRENVTAFGRAFDEAVKKWGKQVVHENLLVAEVQDLSLKVAIEKAFSESGVISLPNGFLAFPLGLRPEIEALVIKNGYVVKRVTSDGPA
jgi:hypothetical protein